MLRIGFVIIRTFVIFFFLIFHPTEMEKKVNGGEKERRKLGVLIIGYRYRFRLEIGEDLWYFQEVENLLK